MLEGREIKRRASALAAKDTFTDDKGNIRVPLEVLAGRPSCPHLKRHGENGRAMMCAEASKRAGYNVHTNWSRCRYDCEVIGGPYDGRTPTEEELGLFMYWMVKAEYKSWSPTFGIEKYARRLASNPLFDMPPERDLILTKCEDLLKHPNVKTVCAIGSLIVPSVQRPLLDFDLMAVVYDFDEYCDDIDGFRSLLPKVHLGKTDWFVGTNPAGAFASVDLLSGVLNVGADFEYRTGDGITGVENFRMAGKWPREFEEMIESMKEKSLPSISTSEAVKNWKKDQNIWRKAAGFTRAIMSGREVDAETYAQRHASCHGTLPDGTVVGKPCAYRKESKRNGYYCGVCGCGDSRLANLSPHPRSGKSKLQFVKLTCPIGAKGFSNHE
jgi:hypothetical protein